MKNKCKHINIRQLTIEHPLSFTPTWEWCYDCGATRSKTRIEIGKWVSPMIAKMGIVYVPPDKNELYFKRFMRKYIRETR